MATNPPIRNKVLNSDIIFAFIIGGILAILLVPLNKVLLDLLLVLSIGISLFVLLIMFYLKRPLDFTSFPSLLLLMTLYRLALNVASTKLILLDGNAGSVIDSFGKFVVGGNPVVGAVVFLVLVLINFMVITKGSGRIAEVTARFTLDAMPGKQMSIDADLNAGIIDEDEARTRRSDLSAEAEFYGSMDGASKFVRGDAIAGLVITGINIAGGFAVGVLQKNMEMGTALEKYTTLTIGDGLVSQIPALVISIGAGVLVTKAASSEGSGLGEHISAELFRRPEPLFVSGVMLIFMGILIDGSFLPFATLGAVVLFLGFRVLARAGEVEVVTAKGSAGAVSGGATAQLPGASANPAIEEEKAKKSPIVKVHPMVLEIGFGLVPLVDPRLNGDLVERVGMIREQVKDEMGFMIPPISIQDSLELGNNEYRILVRGLERARGSVQVGSQLAINPGDVVGSIEGTQTVDPTFGFPAVWINPRRSEAAETKGYTVVDCSSVVTTHVTRVVQDYAADLLSRQAVNDMLEETKKSDSAVVNELIPQRLTVGVVHRVLQFLLEEMVPVHDLPVILETLSDFSGQAKDPLVLCEFCRQALKGHIVSDHLTSNGILCAIALDPQLEQELQTELTRGGGGILGLAPDRIESITDRIKELYDMSLERTEHGVVLLASPSIRPHMYRLVERKIPDLAVLSYAEVSDEVNLKLYGTVSVKNQMMNEVGV